VKHFPKTTQTKRLWGSNKKKGSTEVRRRWNWRVEIDKKNVQAQANLEVMTISRKPTPLFVEPAVYCAQWCKSQQWHVLWKATWLNPILVQCLVKHALPCWTSRHGNYHKFEKRWIRQRKRTQRSSMARALKFIRLRDSVIITNLLISSALLWETCLEARPIWTTGYPSSERKKNTAL